MAHDITILLEEWGRGDKSALDRLAPLVYPQLREIAGAYLRRERGGHTLQATALVSELFLKLMTRREPHFESRHHFYSLTAKLMRMALIDHARVATAGKRGGAVFPVPLHDEIPWVDASGEQMVDLDRALDELAELDAEQAQMFEMRFLIGHTVDEVAEILGTSKSSVDRKVRLGRAWLFKRLHDAEEREPAP